MALYDEDAEPPGPDEEEETDTTSPILQDLFVAIRAQCVVDTDDLFTECREQTVRACDMAEQHARWVEAEMSIKLSLKRRHATLVRQLMDRKRNGEKNITNEYIDAEIELDEEYSLLQDNLVTVTAARVYMSDTVPAFQVRGNSMLTSLKKFLDAETNVRDA